MGKSFLADIPGNRFISRTGSFASVASNGAGAVLLDTAFVCPANLKIVSAFRFAQANEVTVGTATSSASYRRMNIVNGGAAFAGTTIMASLNATASQAASGTRSFATTSNNTASAGDIIFASHLTVGAATADGTDMAAGHVFYVYELI